MFYLMLKVEGSNPGAAFPFQVEILNLTGMIKLELDSMWSEIRPHRITKPQFSEMHIPKLYALANS